MEDVDDEMTGIEEARVDQLLAEVRLDSVFI